MAAGGERGRTLKLACARRQYRRAAQDAEGDTLNACSVLRMRCLELPQSCLPCSHRQAGRHLHVHVHARARKHTIRIYTRAHA
jgi:hypothetical protein